MPNDAIGPGDGGDEPLEISTQFRELLDSAPDAMVIVDGEGRIQFVNVQTESIFGYTRDELIGRRVEVLIPDRYHSMHEEHRTRYYGHPSPRFMGTGRELLALRKNGAEFPVEVSLSPLRTDGGLLVSAAIRDITDRKRTEAVARLAMDRLVSAVESVQQPFAIFDAGDRLVLCNSSFRQSLPESLRGPVLDLTFERLLDLTLEHGMFDCGSEGHAGFRQRRIQYHRDPQGAFDARTADGHYWRILDRRTAEGGIVTTAWDLTEDVRRSEELNEARSIAEAASAAKSDFLSSVSHELRTPLNAILGFAQLLQRDKTQPLNERQQGMVAHISRGGEHLLKLIDEILDLSRIESGNVLLSPEPVRIPELLNEVKSTLAPLAARTGMDLSLEPIPADLPEAFADRTRLSQILMNFGSNALKYGHAGAKAALRAERNAPERIRIKVSDTGKGIPEEKQDRIFQPFHRAGQEAGPIEGTGIGLAISKRLAEMMGASVGFHSVFGKGSEFWIDVRAHVAPEGTAQAPVKAVARPGGVLTGAEGPQFRVLYVEDNPSNLAFMEAFLSGFERIELLTAPTAEIGIELARAHHPDLIILDINLPGMSGYEALQHLKSWEETKDLPVFALSASAMERDVKRATAAGFARYLTKPIRVDELTIALESVLASEK